MQKTRSWQESFDRLEADRREERRLRDAEARKVRDAESAYAKAAAKEAEKRAQPALLLISAKPESDALLVTPKRKSKPATKPAAKRGNAKPAPRKRSAAQPIAANATTQSAKPRAARKSKPEAMALPPTIAATVDAPAELLLITPLPRHASLAPYRKTGLFGLIGSWLRIAKRQAASGLPAGMPRPRLKSKLPAPIDELAELRAENVRLRRQLEALLSLSDKQAKAS